MKTKTISVLLLLFTTRSYAIFGVGDIVYDPVLDANLIAMNSSQLAQWATAIKKYEDQILNQIEQINRLKQLGDLNNTIVGRLGDWKGVYDRARSIQLGADKLTEGWGINYDNAIYIDNGDPALSYTANGSYIEMDVTTLTGRPAVTVNERNLRRYVAVENLYDDLNGTLETTNEVREAILKEIAKTSEELAKAETQAETTKLGAKLDGLRVALANVQSQREEVMQRLLVQHTLNQNQRDKETDVHAAVEAENSAVSLHSIGNAEIGGSTF